MDVSFLFIPSISWLEALNRYTQTTTPVPTSFNFHTTTNCFAGILNQQSCGGCYGFSTASANSDRACWAESIPAPILSPQQIFDCGYPNVWSGSNACDGGYLFEAGQFVATSGLLTAATDALTSGCSPFECASGSCPSATCPVCII